MTTRRRKETHRQTNLRPDAGSRCSIRDSRQRMFQINRCRQPARNRSPAIHGRAGNLPAARSDEGAQRPNSRP